MAGTVSDASHLIALPREVPPRRTQPGQSEPYPAKPRLTCDISPDPVTLWPSSPRQCTPSQYLSRLPCHALPCLTKPGRSRHVAPALPCLAVSRRAVPRQVLPALPCRAGASPARPSPTCVTLPCPTAPCPALPCLAAPRRACITLSDHARTRRAVPRRPRLACRVHHHQAAFGRSSLPRLRRGCLDCFISASSTASHTPASCFRC